ncbi:IclR-like helix-turn-helix domain-containing protein [Chromohalobacter marismortui]|uniref:IclR-like helix-turn-helix domain-containing protein n=1 Tax=Chromohalobacter marismortui TaxID=42055 RepID=A0A4R7NUS6_9GAMM|nr:MULTISPECIES: helix-turn-helix domain-containing protein [Chromohalobacter]MCI0510531.1 helix-turn-helix domain-containing protein [Chromohalobacter sp.]MCI0594116.1 helix-turn-helix domain-containing protein [Chromohalobacter sp.]TDU24893.1 IclR-like helix-turn-helix domain-containing protein [Chromohalobacter marismortui]
MAQDRVEAVERALSIMEAFDTQHESLSLAELAEATTLYKSTLLRLLGSLERYDYVQRDARGRYRLGATPARLARRHAPSRQLASLVIPVLERLSHDTGETAALLSCEENQMECRLSILPDTDLRHTLRPGYRWQWQAGDPRLALPGGAMTCQHIPGTTYWLSLSGPKGRLPVADARRALQEAATALSRRALQDYPT